MTWGKSGFVMCPGVHSWGIVGDAESISKYRRDEPRQRGNRDSSNFLMWRSHIKSDHHEKKWSFFTTFSLKTALRIEYPQILTPLLRSI